MSIYKDCDIRGIYDRELFDQDAYLIGKAVGTVLDGHDIVVCGDVRVSTPQLKAAFIKGLLETGAQVVDIGIAPTPAAYFAKSANGLNTYGLAVITASHNPAQYNGIKLMLGDMPIMPDMLQRLKDIVERRAFVEKPGCCRTEDVMGAYRAYLHTLLPGCDLRITIDCGNGTASRFAPELFRSFGYDVRELYCQADGRFPNRDPNPAVYAHISALCDRVRADGSAFGFAFDGDGDRVVFVDDTGTVVQSEKALVLLIRSAACGEGFSVVYDQKCSSIVRDEIERLGGTPLMERSGHVFIKRTFLARHAVLAGEISGHFFFGEFGYDDAAYAALKMGRIVADSGMRLSELAGRIPTPCITPDIRIPVPYERQDAILESIETQYAQYPIERMDGVRVTLPAGWLLVRKSVTEPALTLRIEADTQAQLQRMREDFDRAILAFHLDENS